MTALEQYAKLEATGRYFDGQSAAPREVVVSFGERSLVIMGLDDIAIAHWPLASLRALGGRGSDSAQLMPYEDSDERLILTDETMIRAIATVCPKLHHRAVDRGGIRRVVFWGGGAIASVLLIVFVLVPALAAQLAPMIPPEREAVLGDAVADQLAELLGATDDGETAFCTEADGRRALTRMTARLTDEVELPYPLKVTVLDHGLVNAVALPGGRVMLFRGLIDEAHSPEEVAGVLAHEIGHVKFRDPTIGVLRAAGTAGIFGLLLGDIVGATVIAAAADAVLNASYQRAAEARADEVAIEIMAEAGLPSSALGDFFARLLEEHGDTPAILKYFASHPELRDRADRVRAADRVGGTTFEPVLGDRDWVALRGICAPG